MFLPDINFWLALAFQSHQHHSVANEWMMSAARQSCFFCRITEMGFLRLATNPKVLPNDVLTMSEAWQVYDKMISDERVVYVEEPANIEADWRSLTETNTFSSKVWTDAYLAAFAQTVDFKVISFDKGFARYPKLKSTILS